jgi:ketol-acid reductoisomerase
MAKIYYDKDCNLKVLEGKLIGIIGYGSQGHAHAQNLRDSGCKVVVAEMEGSPGWAAAKKARFTVKSAADVAREADLVVMLAPDNLQRAIYYQSIEKGMTAGKALMFAHGFNIHYGQITPQPDVDVVMIAPKSPGAMVRQLFTEGGGTPAIVAVEQNASGKARDIALAYAKAIGCSRAGVIETTFAEERGYSAHKGWL